MTHAKTILSFLAWLALSGQATADVLVFGGNGRLGSDVVKNLLEDGEDVVVFVRETSDRSRLAGLDVAYVVGDLLDAETVKAAFEAHEIDAVINTVALRP